MYEGTRTNRPQLIRSSRDHSFGKCGLDISKATDLESALRLASLDWEVVLKKLYYADHGKAKEITTGKGIFRLSKDKETGVELGLAGTEFTPIQNYTNFEICQLLAGMGSTWDRAGSENHGARNWIRMKVAEKVILGDKILGYILNRNSHVPGESFTSRCWEEREICTNGLTALMPGSILLNMRHTGQVHRENLMQRAHQIVEAERQRLEELQVLAERAAKIHLTEERWQGIVNELLPYPEGGGTELQKTRVNEQRSRLYRSINAPDLANFVTNRNGLTILNGWAALSAVSDFSSHLNDAQRKVSLDRVSARLTDLSTKDTILQHARDIVLSSN